MWQKWPSLQIPRSLRGGMWWPRRMRIPFWPRFPVKRVSWLGGECGWENILFYNLFSFHLVYGKYLSY